MTDSQENPKSQATILLKFPPFPTQPIGSSSIIPFKHFKEHGIRMFSNNDIEIDGLGIPTIELGVVHDLDECKTETRRKILKDGIEGKRGTNATVEEPVKLNNPMEKAKDQRHQRYLLFAKKEWFDQWSEGEHLRGVKTYDPSLSSVSRIHQASTDFRIGRIWPPPHTQLTYLWDQFRLYTGLLGTAPIWTRTDLPQPEGFNDEDEIEIDQGPPPRSSAAPIPRHKRGTNDEISDDDDEFIANIKPADEQYPQRPPAQTPRKWTPARPPYEFYNKDPIPVGSDAEVRVLLAHAAVEKERKLLAFLNDPEKSVKVFLSSYMRKEGLVWTPSFLTYLPLLLSFFLSFLIRSRALPECERQLKRAVEIAREAVTELPCTGRLCRLLPDAMGKGAKACWGTKWEARWDFGLTEQNNNDSNPTEASLPEGEGKGEEEALKMFEDEVKKANLQLLSKETIFGPEQPLASNLVNEQQSDDEQIGIQIMSPTSPEPTSPTAKHSAENPNWALAPETPALPNSPPPLPPQPFPPVVGSGSNLKGNKHQISDDESKDSEEEEEDPRSWASPTGRPPTRSQKLAANAAWFPPPTQPIMSILGMTVLPLRYENGIAERSLRKITSVLKPGEGSGGGKWRGVEEELVKRLVRVVLGPCSDWDDGGVAPEFKTPTLVGVKEDTTSMITKEGSEHHDPFKDDITVLVEPNIANSLIVGMGLAGTWVQLIPFGSENIPGRGRGRGTEGATRKKEQRFWYIEELSMAIPSFWTVGEEVEEIEADEEDIANVGRRWIGT